ncbi:MAG: hypothetical protein MK132_21135 [Lentisphaerales bacterium]|nr:hypothetical protein [Lentisphaerales bacterium]
MNKFIFTTAFLFASIFSLAAQKLEIENQNSEPLFIIKMTGARSDLTAGNIKLHCSNRPGNKTYLDKSNTIKLRTSVKLNHISIYSHPENKQLYRISKKINRFTITSPKGHNYFIRINGNGAKLTDGNSKVIAKANYNPASNNIKCSDDKSLPGLTYKWSSANFAGIIWLINEIPSNVRMVMINELIR